MIALIFGIAMIGLALDGRWGASVFCLAVVVLMIMIGHAWREGDRAYGNMIDYWARGGPDRKE